MKKIALNCLKVVGLAFVFSSANASPEHVSNVSLSAGDTSFDFIQKQLEDKFSLYAPKGSGPVILYCRPWPECELHQPQSSFSY
ncbi:hypothetical protein [Shewanella waksmanii]|uniref:hypothetical protein n=1 Tax=Shewanella waksmanii TaxID=213783 RepID=UPI0037351F2A